MKHLAIQSALYRKYVGGFKEWISTLGYAAATVDSMPTQLQEFLHYCEACGVGQVEAMTRAVVEAYISYIRSRKNSRREGALSSATINGHTRMLRRFSEYLLKLEGLRLVVAADYIPVERERRPVVLTVEEIKALYGATDNTPYGIRDRAMLAVYYGCGLRKSEGVRLDVTDMLLDQRLLLVRKSKNNHERYVPLTKSNAERLQEWLYNGRELFVQEGGGEPSFFVTEQGRRLGAGSMYVRLKQLQQKAGISQETGLHTLRHSIATHLLQKGMPLESIAMFLGHRCLDSAQMYTHIINEA